MFHAKELTSLIIDILEDMKEACDYILKYFSALYQNGSQNLLVCLIKLANETNKKNRPVAGLQVLIDKLLEEFGRISESLARCMGNPPNIEKERLEKMYQALLNKEELEEMPNYYEVTLDWSTMLKNLTSYKIDVEKLLSQKLNFSFDINRLDEDRHLHHYRLLEVHLAVKGLDLSLYHYHYFVCFLVYYFQLLLFGFFYFY